MPRGGHNAKPDEVLKLHGTYDPYHHANRGVKTGGEPLRKPEGMSVEAEQMWDRVADIRRAWLCSSDAEALQAMCECWGLRCRVLEALHNDPTDKNTRVAFKDYQTMFVQLASRFGLTPADRARLGEGADAHAAKSEIEDMIA